MDSLRDQIPAGFKPYIESRTSLKVVADCKNANYVISGRVSIVETEMSNFGINILTGGATSTARTFGIGVQGVIKENKTSEVISNFEDFQHYSSLQKTFYNLADVVIDGAKYYYPPKSK